VVIFSHGNLMNRDMWAPQVEALRGEFRCVTWDERLHGRTKDDGGLYTYWDSADDLLGLLDHLGAGQATLAGHSQGGFLSLRAALRAPGRVKALVLIDTAAVAWPPETLAQMSGIRDRFRDGGPDAVAVLMGADDISARLSQITQPALIVHGEADQPIPLPLGQMLRDRLPGAVDLIVIPGAGHTPSLTHPYQVNSPLADFRQPATVFPCGTDNRACT
jgi:3-oxoadipate enol-lactonase